MADKSILVAVKELTDKYSESASNRFVPLYEAFGPISELLALFHTLLNKHFLSINKQAKGNNYYWADPSRELITLRDDINEFIDFLYKKPEAVKLHESYRLALDKSEDWLSWSGGSEIPEDYNPVSLQRYEPIFTKENDNAIQLKKSPTKANLQHRGSGSFADVFSFKDPDYGIRFALKKAKKGLSDSEYVRFEKEFNFMKKISSPYVLKVYKYNAEERSYTMEYCDYTLHDYIHSKGNNLGFGYRKRIAQQFLYGVVAIHSHQILHRDFSLWNVLIQEFDSNVVQVKISDFGLSKTPNSALTASRSHVKGTFADPSLESFHDYKLEHEIYAIGRVLIFIFTGKKSTDISDVTIKPIIQKCIDSDRKNRYQSIEQILGAINLL